MVSNTLAFYYNLLLILLYKKLVNDNKNLLPNNVKKLPITEIIVMEHENYYQKLINNRQQYCHFMQ